MVYPWSPDEEIKAWKLNAMQIDPLLKAVNNRGVIGGIISSALSSDTIDKDIGTGAGRSVAAEITEHELGNIHYEYDDGNNRWAMRSGSPGVTGKVEGSTGELRWNCDDFNCKQVNWQKITTDKWGNVICSEQVIDGGTHSTKMWNPKTCEGGEIWRRMGTIEADCKYKLPEGKSALMTWKYKAVNENNAFILPVPRQDGWETPAVLNVCTDTEVAPRTSNSHWIQTAGPDTGASVPIQGVGELGGIFTYQAQDHNGNNVGIGLASGIEFYDSNTINCRNTDNPRPKSTTAKVDFGSCGKYGYIQISNVNPKHPWQFQLSGHFDPGSGGFRPDPGSGGITICKAQGPICYRGAGYYGWIGRGTGPTQELKEGIIDGSITRLTNGANLYCGKYSDIYYAYRPGEIIDGGIGIATAKFEWTSSYNKNSPTDGDVIANNHGGVVTGIVNDSPCRAYIDDNGFIHLPNPEWMGKYGVKIPCANNPLAPDGNPQNSYHIAEGNMCLSCSQLDWAKAYAPNCDDYKCGIVNGKVCTMNFDDDISFKYVYPNCKARMTSRIGDVANGTIRLGISKFSSRYGTMVSANTDWNLTTKDFEWGIQWRPSGGIIRGIKNDIWINCVPDPNKSGTYHYMPYSLPFIDTWGVLHLPQWHISYEEICGSHKIHVWTGRCGIPKYPNGVGWTSNALPPANQSSGPDNNWGQSNTGGGPIKRT